MSATQAPTISTPVETPGLVRALRVLRERWWVVVLCPLVALAVALVYVERQPKQYTATAKLQFISNSLPSQVAGVAGEQVIDPEGVKATDVQLVTTPPVAELVIAALKLKLTPAQLLEEVSASNPNNDYVIDVTATVGDPRQAAAIANAFAEQYVVYSKTQNVEQLVKGEELIDKKIEELPTTDTVDRGNLRGLYQKLLLLQSVQTGNAHVVSTASSPSSPSSPKKKTTALIALVVGLLLGIGIAFVLDLLDRRVKSWEEFEELYGVPALAAIPKLPNNPRDTRERELALEPFRILFNSLSLLPNTNAIETVLVTSAVPVEGKTSVALGLARAAAHTGRQVILVEADLRRPALEERMGLDISPRGLTSALRGEEDPLKLLRTPGGELGHTLRLLPSGPVALNLTGVLNPARLSEIFIALADDADLIVIDSAPLLPVADTRVMLDGIDPDASLVVARAGFTTRDQVRRARLTFERRRLKAVGLVVNTLSEITSGYDYYGSDRSEGAAPPTAADTGASTAPAGGSRRSTERTSATLTTRSTSKQGT
ncbi:MAG TPA: GNVR domain-containing protein [Solirubrobacteraceae bacterium]|jgi:capsular polysaccharide biosynthesis protein/Mrp family chromosome partitioning ATPase|nr:GNVR domain-containing protein [Solirubrobacteraceae bacterium]